MRTIDKGHEPQSLRLHRASGGTYGDFTQTDDIRHALLDEQGHLCCYCMRRIVLRGMKIEHWASQSGNADETVSWNNLLGACMGGQGESAERQHCDTAKGFTSITVNPVVRERRCEHLIRYRPDGEIASDDPEIHKDLDQTLKLNHPWMKAARRGILDSAISRLTKVQGGYWSRGDLEAELEKWKRRDEAGELREFCQVAVYRLQKKLGERKA
jgi:uncharacterized protein (TIGR02646 family)